MQRNNIKQIALGGMLAAVALVIMCLGGMIPIATYVLPMLCCMTQLVVLRFCGRRLAWAWFAVVSILALLLSPDKEAAMVFLLIGYYPLIKHYFDLSHIRLLWKILYFNASIFVAYTLMIFVLGMQEIAAENMEFGLVGLGILMFLGNGTFLLLDKLLAILSGKLR